MFETILTRDKDGLVAVAGLVSVEVLSTRKTPLSGAAYLITPSLYVLNVSRGPNTGSYSQRLNVQR